MLCDKDQNCLEFFDPEIYYILLFRAMEPLQLYYISPYVDQANKHTKASRFVSICPEPRPSWDTFAYKSRRI